MPTRTEWVTPEVFITHNGTSVYHTYHDDDVDQGKCEYWYTLNCHHDDSAFDVRDLIDEAAGITGSHEDIIRKALDLGRLRADDAVE